MSDRVTFVLCIENNGIRDQALLLCESIRAFGGEHRDAAIVAVAPRPGLGVDRATRQRLDALHVRYAEEPLNTLAPLYGSANRVFTAAWAETRVTSEWIVVLDSDTLFFDELVLPANGEAAARPVDSKWTATEGPGDPREEYWARLAALHGVSLDILPMVRTTDQKDTVRASYNGGFVVVRRECGLLQQWADLFSRSLTADMKPWKGSQLNVFASTGYVGPEATEYWGSNQAALALVLWSSGVRVAHYPESYNVPLHILVDRPDLVMQRMQTPLVHVHYHWLFSADHHLRAIETLQRLGLGAERLDWLRKRLPLGA